MRALSAFELLDICEQAWSREPADRALILASGACPDMDAGALERLTIGRRDSLLVEARRLTFGSRVECITGCPDCAAVVELTFDLSRQPQDTADSPTASFVVDGFEIALRLPNTGDMRAASRVGGIDEARRLLFDRCVVVVQGGCQIAIEDVPAAVLEAVAGEMERRDPQADVRLGAVCPACGHAWAAAFDIASYFWREIQRTAMRLLRDVHTLASAYGWSESDILRMTSWRREAYLNMAAGSWTS